jgi:hypothetical protein
MIRVENRERSMEEISKELWGNLKHFPVREKLIAPGTQHIEYTVIHKTRRSIEELHNKVGK